MAYYFSGSTYDRQSRRATIAQDRGQWDTPLPLLSAAGEVAPMGQSTALTARPPVYDAPRRLRDYTWKANSPPYYLTGEIAPMGVQFTELPPKTRPRSLDYTWVQSAPLCIFGELPFGQSTRATELPARAPARSRDYTYTDVFFLGLIGADAVNPGQQSTDTLPPRTRPRSRDYTWEASGPPFYLNGEVAPVGAQSFALPPRGVPRGADLSTPYNLTVWLDFAAQQVIGPGKSTDATVLPPSGPSRSRDYSYIDPTEIWLIGTDALVTGTQFTANPPRAPQRAAQLYDPLLNFTLYNDAGTTPPPPAGVQFTDIPPKAAPRARDYSWLNRLPNLIGQDAVNPGKSTDATALPPRGPARSRDYTWLQSLPLHIYQQLPPGESTLSSELPPKGPLRLKDYTYLHLSDTRLIGQDSMVVGQPWLDTDNLPPRAYARLRDYTWLQSFSLPELQLTTNPGHHALSDRVLFMHTLTDRALFLQTLTDRALVLHNLRDQEAGG